MRLIGLTGGYASGKSLVAETIARLGGEVIDLDHISRQLCSIGGVAIEPLREAFGDQIITPDGRLDRGKMGAIVFADATKRERLESILHPLMRAATLERASTLMRDRPSATVVVDGGVGC